MIRRSLLFFSMIMVLSITGCVKETYDMNKLSNKAHLSPTIAIPVIKGDISIKDIVESRDNFVIDQNKLVYLVYKRDSLIDMSMADFHSSGSLPAGKLMATFDPYTLNLGIEYILNRLTGDIFATNPSIRLYYTNSFVNPIQVTLDIEGKRNTKTIDLDLPPFPLVSPVAPDYLNVNSYILIDKSNTLDSLVSLPPEEITFSGNAIMTLAGKKSLSADNLLAQNKLIGSIEVEVPLDLKMNNLSFADTVDNFLKDENGDDDVQVKPENFKYLRVDLTAKNSFPFGVSSKMSLYDSNTHVIKSSVTATGILLPAPVDINGKVTGTTETSTSIEFTSQFFNSIDLADKIIFQFTLNTTGNETKSIKIYSDYRIDFNTALVINPDIKLK